MKRGFTLIELPACQPKPLDLRSLGDAGWRRQAKAAFTLIELLAVMTVIIILAGLVIGIAGNVQKSSVRNRAKVEIAALENALERYQIDNGSYPDWQAAPINSDGTPYNGDPSTYITGLTGGTGDGNRSLFEQLVGRENFDSRTRTGPTYIEINAGQAGLSGNSAYFMDPFGYAYGYAFDPAPTAGNPKSTFNRVAPDLWSTAGETEGANPNGSDDEKAVYLNWVTNWGNQ